MSLARRAPTLAALLGSVAAAVCALGLARSLGGATLSHTLDADPGVRVVGLALVGSGWFILRAAPGVSIGMRRFAARAAASGLLFAGAGHLGGPAMLGLLDPLLPLATPPGTRTLACAALLAAATGYAWRTSPLRR